jgi:hypothetical protein
MRNKLNSTGSYSHEADVSPCIIHLDFREKKEKSIIIPPKAGVTYGIKEIQLLVQEPLRENFSFYIGRMGYDPTEHKITECKQTTASYGTLNGWCLYYKEIEFYIGQLVCWTVRMDKNIGIIRLNGAKTESTYTHGLKNNIDIIRLNGVKAEAI